MIECSDEMVTFLTLESFEPETTLVERLEHVQKMTSDDLDHLNTDREEPFHPQRIVGELAALIEEYGDASSIGEFVEAEGDEADEDDEDIDDDMDEEDPVIEE